jgi:hypothetical protein
VRWPLRISICCFALRLWEKGLSAPRAFAPQNRLSDFRDRSTGFSRNDLGDWIVFSILAICTVRGYRGAHVK